MLQPTFTNTQAAQPGGAAPGFAVNNDFVLQQPSLFTGGKITDNRGAFIQGTYNGVNHRFAWDNTHICLEKQINIDGHTLLWGGSVNNNPTVQAGNPPVADRDGALELAGQAAPYAVQRLIQLMDSEDERVAAVACNSILDRRRYPPSAA